MKCPKCAYVSHDYLDTCRNSKCGIDLIDFKVQMQLYAIQPGTISLMSILGSAQDHAAVAGGAHDSLFDSQMLIDTNNTNNTNDFNISLDENFSLTSRSIKIDESADMSGAFNISNLNFDVDSTPTGTRFGQSDTTSYENSPSKQLIFNTTEIQLPPVHEKDMPLADTLDDAAIAPANIPEATNHKERFEFPPLPNTQESDPSDKLDPTVISEFTSISQDSLNQEPAQLLEERFELPELSNFTAPFDTTVADVPHPQQPSNPLTHSIPFNEGTVELPPPKTAEFVMPKLQNEAIIDEANAVTIAAATCDLAPSAQDITFVDAQEATSAEPASPPLNKRTRSKPLEDVAFTLPSPKETELQLFGAQDETVMDDHPPTGLNTSGETLSQPSPSQIDNDRDFFST